MFTIDLTKFVISGPDAHYQAWPDLLRTRSGKLLCAFSACTHHCDRSFTQIMLCESQDDGRTWSAPHTVSDTCGFASPKGYYYNNAALSQLSDGRIALVYDRIDGQNENLSPSHIMHSFSTDDGATWSEAIMTPTEGIVPDKLLELASGRWLQGCHRYDPSSDKLVQRLWYSDDQGASWSGPVVVCCDPQLNLCEGSILETAPGTLVCFMRENSGIGLPCYRAISHDNGLTWSGPHPFPIPACHSPKAGFLRDGRIVITYRMFQGGAVSPQNLMLALVDTGSAVEPDYRKCRTRLLAIDHDFSDCPDTGYSGWVQLPDGTLYIANYIRNDAERAWICGYHLDFNGLTASHSAWEKHNA
ncbi:MAG: exo-alpha-sialidase [Victivallales bacterium]|nr:exo-alpha-sialidase [Victivallales bacterium]